MYGCYVIVGGGGGMECSLLCSIGGLNLLVLDADGAALSWGIRSHGFACYVLCLC